VLKKTRVHIVKQAHLAAIPEITPIASRQYRMVMLGATASSGLAICAGLWRSSAWNRF
jgi:hypothetical protein